MFRSRSRLGSAAASAALAATVAAFGLGVASSAAASRCSNYVEYAHGAAAVYIADWSGVGCSLRRRIARGAIGVAPGHPRRVLGFRCRYQDVNAGGGAARCTRGSRYVELEFQ